MKRVGPAVGELGAALGEVRWYRERPTGTVRIQAPRLAVELYLDPILGSFHRAYPDVTLDITIVDAIVDVVAAGYNVALRMGEFIGRDMVAVGWAGSAAGGGSLSRLYRPPRDPAKPARANGPSLHPLALAGTQRAL